MCCVPRLVAYMPVINVDLDGAQTGALANAFSYRIPSEANLSIRGVLARLSPYSPDKRAVVLAYKPDDVGQFPCRMALITGIITSGKCNHYQDK
jgi:hypothetical protein